MSQGLRTAPAGGQAQRGAAPHPRHRHTRGAAAARLPRKDPRSAPDCLWDPRPGARGLQSAPSADQGHGARVPSAAGPSRPQCTVRESRIHT